MKLEAKHLASYLPYKLQVEYRGEVVEVNALDSTGGAYVGKDRVVSFVNQSHIKPTLRPLSSITKKEARVFVGMVISMGDVVTEFRAELYSNSIMFIQDTKYGEYIVEITMNELEFEAYYQDYGTQDDRYSIPYKAIEWLFENHFDVFGLIEKGLAIAK